MSAEVLHGLGALVCVALGLWLLMHQVDAVRRERTVRRRLGTVLLRESLPSKLRPTVRNAVRRWLPVAGAVCAAWVLAGGLMGLLLGLAAGCGIWRWGQRHPGARLTKLEYDPVEVARQLPLAADLLAACITAGAGPAVAARAVGEALGGPLGERLALGAAEARLGGEPAEAWRALASLPGAVPLARLLERAEETGVPVAALVARLAAEARAAWGRTATERARRAAVMVTVPVGLCFLPAFIAIGVLPVVIGLADGLLEGGGGMTG